MVRRGYLVKACSTNQIGQLAVRRLDLICQWIDHSTSCSLAGSRALQTPPPTYQPLPLLVIPRGCLDTENDTLHAGDGSAYSTWFLLCMRRLFFTTAAVAQKQYYYCWLHSPPIWILLFQGSIVVRCYNIRHEEAHISGGDLSTHIPKRPEAIPALHIK